MSNKKAIPDDPTTHGDDFVADPTGATGVTVSSKDLKTPKTSDEQKMSDEAYDSADDTATAGERSEEVLPPLSDTNDQIDIVGARINSPASAGEASESGSTPDPESDDDVLANAHDMGIALGEDEEHPKELNIADDIDKAEEYQRTH